MRVFASALLAAAVAAAYDHDEANRNGPLLLLFDHLPKGGGHAIESKLLNDIGRPLLKRRLNDSDTAPTPENFIVLNEFESLTDRDRQTYFTLGAVREPCSYYLSLWAYGSEMGGRASKFAPADTLGQTSPFTNSADLDRFTRWLQYSKGMYGERFEQSYGAISPDRVDCWIRTERLDEDYDRCLHRFRLAGGRTTGRRRLGCRGAGDRTHCHLESHPSSHEACEHYFDDARRELVVNDTKAFYDKFYYKGCCSKTTTEPWPPGERS